jgi:5-methylthioadenosine/S-adenosylhomocysteine deaminase
MDSTANDSGLVVRDVTALPMARRGEVLEHVDLVIRGPLIAAIGPTGTLEAPTRARVIDGRGRLALPGLVNAHTHLGITILRAGSEAMALEPWLEWLIPLQLELTPDDLYWSAQLGCLEQTRAGITTCADMFGIAEPSAEAVEASGLRALLSNSVMEPDVDGDEGEGRRRLERSIDFAVRWQGRGGGRIGTRLAPHAVYTVRPSLLRAFGQSARQTGLGLQIHCSETRTEVERCRTRHGRTPSELLADCGLLELPIVLHHAVHLSDGDIALVDRSNAGISHNPGSNLKLQSGLARLPELVDRQVGVGLGTDSAVSNDSLDLLKEAYLAAVLHTWPPGSSPSWRALELATIGGARALGLADQIGSLEVGKRADVILVDQADPRWLPGGNPARQLAYAARGTDVVTTIVDGEILMDERVVRRLDPEQIGREVRARRARLLVD